MKLYFACEVCNAKWFEAAELSRCPRCGCIESSTEMIAPPWEKSEPTEMHTVAEVAAKLKVSPRLVYKLVESGAPASYRVGTAIRISDEQLQSYLTRDVPAPVLPTKAKPTTLRRLRV